MTPYQRVKQQHDTATSEVLRRLYAERLRKMEKSE